MNAQRLLQLFAAALLCAGGSSCNLFKKESSTDPYSTDGGYNPYNNQPGQVASTYQQYQPSQDSSQQQYQQPQQPQYQTYTPSQDSTPEEEYKPSPAPAPKKKKSSSSSGGGGYTVKQGDTLYRIALNHGTTVSRLKNANGLTSDLIRPGQHLTLP